jgi:glycolate oxidase FAD binding subunit
MKTVMALGARNDLLAAAGRVIDARLFPVAVELISPQLACEADWADGKDHLLLLRFAGSSSAVAHQTRFAQALFDGGPGQEASGPDETKIWESLAAMPLKFKDRLSWRASVPPGNLGQFLDEMQKRSDADVLWHAGVGDGRVRVVERLHETDNGSPECSKESVARTVVRIGALQDIASSVGGALIVETAPAELKRQVNPWGNFGSTAALMQRVKNELDPDGILSPGRFFD